MKNHKISDLEDEWRTPPWPLAIELSQTLPSGSWLLVGGLMVRLHTLIDGLQPSRATTDVDGVVTLLRDGGTSYLRLAATLEGIGFTALDTQDYLYRFQRSRHSGNDLVDLMLPDRVPERAVPRFQQRPVFRAPGSTRALLRMENVSIDVPGSGSVSSRLPSLQGALVLKGAAYQHDSRARERHLTDALSLLACVEDIQTIHEGLSLESRKRVRALLRALQSREPWTLVDPITRDLAEDVYGGMRALFDVDGTINPEAARRHLGEC